MPTGPKGEKRPADVIGNAVKIAQIATGEVEDKTRPEHDKNVSGGIARAKSLTPDERAAIAKQAAMARWGKGEK